MSIDVRGTYGTMYYVNDMAKTVKYYKETIGLTPKAESPEWTEFDIKGHALCFHAVEKGQTKKADDQGVLIITVKGLTALVESLKQKGVEFLGPIKEVYPGAYSAEFKDPSGNVVSIYEDLNK